MGDRDPASIVQSDGTTVMNFIERRGGKRAGCWAHARRKLVEAARNGDTLALEGLRIIARLFVVEHISQICDESPEQRKARRQQHSTMVLDELRAWVDQHRGSIPPKSPLGKALKYIHRQWPRLVLFLEDGRIELTNNHVERALRTLVLGLKNWLFTYEDVGACRAATILTVLGTCIAQQVNPRLYLHAVLERIVNGRPGDELGDLLPDRLAEQLPALRVPIRDGPDEQRLTETIAELEAALEPKTRVPQLGPKAS